MLPHPRRQPAPGRVLVDVDVAAGDHVSHQPPITPGILPDGHRRLAHPRISGQHRLHLRLDPEPADLHLIISVLREHQLPTAGPPRQVPGPVHPVPAAPERARHKPLPGQPRPPQIPSRQASPGHVQLPGHPRRHRAQPLVQHEQTRIGDRPANGGSRQPVTFLGKPRSGVYRRLRRPIDIGQVPFRKPLTHQRDVPRGIPLLPPLPPCRRPGPGRGPGARQLSGPRRPTGPRSAALPKLAGQRGQANHRLPRRAPPPPGRKRSRTPRRQS